MPNGFWDMPDTFWAIVTPLLSPLISLAGLVWAVVQVKNALRQNYQKVYDMNIGIDKFFFEHPEMRSYFYPDIVNPSTHGPAVPDDPAVRSKVDAVAEMLLDFFDSVCHQKGSLPAGTYDNYTKYMQTIYHYSPVLKAFLEARNEWYPPRLGEILRKKGDNGAEGH